MRLAALLTLLAAPLAAHEYQVGGITIDHPFAFEADGPVAEAYVIFVNSGPADTLLGVKAEANVTLKSADGTALATIDIPANGAAELFPGGAYLLFEGLTEAWEEGDQISATFTFEKAGDVPVVFYIEERS